ncbi:LysR family transcriptional regulator [Sphingomonas sp. BIUV-7]|uniref:LysR family transcriptional regulator n=1 Tax=Sphingomonas natans TaxID=3063330 RepID=A0ABT8YAJ3_9SPHN|nr:LysR family transcriptional regulator [Sphingomonas sp. BIUV-7]MDO6415330.1 LysR family transcriptional regulator [Sphingomonas sp. BIUV-7]
MRYKGLDLNLLLALDVLLEVRNVSRAADRLGLSQSAMSAALARLRYYFDDELLVVEGRRMHPTPYAEQLASHVRECLVATDTLLATSRAFDPATAERTFRIIGSDYVIASVLVGVARRLADIAPGIRLEFILPEETAAGRLDRGELDLMISPPEFLLPSHPMEELYVETHVIAGWRDNPIFQKPLTEKGVFSAGHVAVSLGTHRTTTFGDRQIELLKYDRRIEAVVSSFMMVPWMLVGTDRLAVMHRRLAVMMADHVAITHAALPFAFPDMHEMAQYHRTRVTDIGLQWLISQIREAAAR